MIHRSTLISIMYPACMITVHDRKSRALQRTTKYSLMKPPTRKLIGGVRESHTKDYLFQISAQTMGCRERSRFRVQEQIEHETRSRTHAFEKKEREWGERCHQGAWGPPRRVGGAARGWAAPPGLLAWWWPPWSATGALWWPFTWKPRIFFL